MLTIQDVIDELDIRISKYQENINELKELNIANVFIKENLERQRSLIELKDIFISIEKRLEEKKKKDMCDAYSDLDNDVGFDYNCSKCGHRFMESESYKWRINNRIIDCCPKCKQPIMYARENK